MPTVLLVRHGLTAMTGPVLAGWTPGLHLDDRGTKQALAVAERIAVLPIAALVSSPLDRCLDTAGYIQRAQRAPVELQVDDRIGECRYGDWTGRELKTLAKDPLWKVVQQQPSAVTFPGPEGEALRDTQSRAVAAMRDWDARVAEAAGPDAVWVACTHGDVIKAITADACGMHLDLFQRLTADPCSVTAIRYTSSRPFVLRQNDTGAPLEQYAPPKKRRRRTARDDAAVGGGAGAGA